MQLKIGIVMDPIQHINYKKDSSLAMLWAAQDKGWDLFYMELQDLYLEDSQPKASAKPINVFKDPEKFYEMGEPTTLNLGDLDVILMRKDPPFDQEYIYSTYILERAEMLGALIVNKPQSLRDCNEKFFATLFPNCCNEHIVSRDPAKLRNFLNTHKDVIYKPLDGMGGSSIFRVTLKDPNISVILETLTQFGTQQIMAQKYIPEILQGDKRILMINGEPVPYALARIPAAGETRGNLAAGGTGVAQPLSERDIEIAKTVGPILKEKGLIFVGLDVIGHYLTEINVTSPTCIREISDQFNIDIAKQLMDCIEELKR